MKTRTKIILGLVALPVLLIALPIGIGATLPEKHQAEGFVLIDAGLERCFEVAADFEKTHEWRKGSTSVKRLADRDGKAVYEEETEFGPMRYQVDVLEKPKRIVTRIVDHEDFGGTWTHSFVAEGGKTKMTIVEDGEVYS